MTRFGPAWALASLPKLPLVIVQGCFGSNAARTRSSALSRSSDLRCGCRGIFTSISFLGWCLWSVEIPDALQNVLQRIGLHEGRMKGAFETCRRRAKLQSLVLSRFSLLSARFHVSLEQLPENNKYARSFY